VSIFPNTLVLKLVFEVVGDGNEVNMNNGLMAPKIDFFLNYLFKYFEVTAAEIQNFSEKR